MKKKVDIKKQDYVLFCVNLGILITLFIFRFYYLNTGYHVILVNVMLLINVLLLLLGISFNIFIFKKGNYFNEKKIITIIIVCFIIYLLINTLGVYLINKHFDKGYTKISVRLSSYCNSYGCDRYETIKSGIYEEFIIKKQYFDYNNVKNSIEIYTKYNSKKIISITSIIYSEKDLFSETLINEQLKGYYKNFNCELSEEKIKEAFNNRFNNKVIDGNTIYKVTEIYNKGQLDKLKTEITLNFN